jgi:hypothetical protein
MRKLLYASTVHQVETLYNIEAIYMLVIRVPVGTYTTTKARGGLDIIIFMMNIATNNFTSFIVTTGYAAEVRLPAEARSFTSPRRPDRFWGPPQPLIQLVPGATYFPEGKAAGA